MNAFLLTILYAGGGIWLLVGLARVHTAWQASQQQTSGLRQVLAAAARKLLGNLETIQKFDDDIKRVESETATALREQSERHEAIARSTPPPPPEIRVVSEYPTSRKDAAWVVKFVRDSELPRQPWEREPMTSLIWAPNHVAALARAKQLVEQHKAYGVDGVAPLV